MSDPSTIHRTGRSSNREIRRAARSHRAAAKLPYIHRRIPTVELLHSEAVEIIEANAETILEEIGI